MLRAEFLANYGHHFTGHELAALPPEARSEADQQEIRRQRQRAKERSRQRRQTRPQEDNGRDE